MNARTGIAAALLCACATVSTEAQTRTALIPASKDNTLFENPFGLVSNGAGVGLYAGVSGQPSIRRAVMAFDIAGSIPAGSTVLSAELRLQLDQSTNTAASFDLHRLTADWGEGTSAAAVGGGIGGGGGAGAPSTVGDATWLHTFFNTANWASAGGDFVAAASATTNVSSSLGRKTWSSAQMVTDVQGWVNNGSNFGWLLKTTDETIVGSAKRFNSKEHDGVTTRPMLVVTFTGSAGAATSSSGYGCGTPGFALAISAPPVIGTSFNASVANGAAGGSCEFYLSSGISTNYIPFPGSTCGVWVDIPSTLAAIAAGTTPLGPFPLNASGGFSFTAALPNIPALIGSTITAQATSIDPSTGTLLTSNALVLIIG